MAKSNRGKHLWKTPSRGRGTCPVCLATRIKLLYTQKKSDGTSLKVCKRCSKVSKEKLDQAPEVSHFLAYRRKHRKALHLVGSK